MTFVSDVLSGRVSLEDIDSYHDKWNESKEDLGEFHDFLGLLWPEYAMWVEDDGVLRYVIESRRSGVELRDLLRAREAEDATAAELLRLSSRYSAEWEAVTT
ncbi:hypothetical protein ACWCOZ_10225 [Streptomyces sp. NPDC001840]